MIAIKNVRALHGRTTDLQIPSSQDFSFDAEGTLLQLPALIDPFATRLENPEEILKSGVNTLLVPPDKQAHVIHLPLHTRHYLSEFHSAKEKKEAPALWIEAAQLKINEEERADLDRLFQVAAQEAIVVAVHLSEPERQKKMHLLLELTMKYNNEIIFMDLSNSQEIEMVKEAKSKELMAYAATTVEQLEKNDMSLWRALGEGFIEMIGSGATSTLKLLPFLLNACHEGKLTLERVVALNRRSIEELFRIPTTSDLVLVNTEKKQAVFTIVEGQIFRL